MVLVVMRGEISTGGHPIRIERISESDRAINVTILRAAPGKCHVSEGYTYPVDAVIVAKSGREIRWSYRDEIYDCPGGRTAMMRSVRIPD